MGGTRGDGERFACWSEVITTTQRYELRDKLRAKQQGITGLAPTWE